MHRPVVSLRAITLLAVLAAVSSIVDARPNRQGKEVVDAVCAACHASGKDGAPKIGDNAAWARRADQGLTALTARAITGIRKMPAHGGSTGVSDVELERAIVYMVNRSGGHWIDPVSNGGTIVARTSESIVRSQCAQCHQPGTQGAPKIGDRSAWTPRLAMGLDALVASAVHGHGPMPSRGGMPELSDTELRGAILYMFNYGLPPAPQAPVAAPADPNHKTIAGMDIYFGMIQADALRASQAQAQAGATKLDIPSGNGYYHLSVAVKDNKSQAPVSDAQVTMKVSDGMVVESKTLTPVAANNGVSYGNFFKFTSGNAYNITTEIKRPGARAVTTNFEFRAP